MGQWLLRSSSPLSSSNALADGVWGEYFNNKLASSSPVERESARKRVLNAYESGSKWDVVKNNPDEYPSL